MLRRMHVSGRDTRHGWSQGLVSPPYGKVTKALISIAPGETRGIKIIRTTLKELNNTMGYFLSKIINFTYLNHSS